MNKTFKAFVLSGGAFAMVLSAVPASAQFGRLLGRSSDKSEQSDEQDCRSKPNAGRSVASGILGGLARRATGGLASFVPVEAFADVLVTEIACQLDEKEQEQAAEATVEVTAIEVDEEGNEVAPEVGKTVAWTSNTREGVSGTSTVTAREGPERSGSGGNNGNGNGNANAGGKGQGNDCITVTDVVIVEGEETRADKRMCRLAGAARYTIVA